MLVAPMKQGEGAIEHESPTGLIRFHQHGWELLQSPRYRLIPSQSLRALQSSGFNPHAC